VIHTLLSSLSTVWCFDSKGTFVLIISKFLLRNLVNLHYFLQLPLFSVRHLLQCVSDRFQFFHVWYFHFFDGSTRMPLYCHIMFSRDETSPKGENVVVLGCSCRYNWSVTAPQIVCFLCTSTLRMELLTIIFVGDILMVISGVKCDRFSLQKQESLEK
jgi:hypothetical protein